MKKFPNITSERRFSNLLCSLEKAKIEGKMSDSDLEALKKAFLTSHEAIPKPLLVKKALQILDEVSKQLEQKTKEKIKEKKQKTNLPEEIYTDFAWSESFAEIEQSTKKSYQELIKELISKKEDPEIKNLPSHIFVILAATPMLRNSLSIQLLLIWKEKQEN